MDYNLNSLLDSLKSIHKQQSTTGNGDGDGDGNGNGNGISAQELNQVPPSILSILSTLTAINHQNELNKLKVISLRSSLSQLSTHLSSLNTQLLSSHTESHSFKLSYQRDVQKLTEERDGWKALCVVWEGRWREERRGREMVQLHAQDNGEKRLNGKVLGGNGLVVLKKLVPPPRTHSRHSSSASSSSSSSSHETATEGPSTHFLRHSHSTPKPRPRQRTKQLVGDITRELERVRREGDRLLGERDERIQHLEIESRFRSSELASLYSSLDTLLASASSLSSQESVSDPTPTVRPPSVLDRTPFREAKKASKGKGKGKEEDTRRLEEEVRELERQVRGMGGSVDVLDLGQETAEELQSTIRSLNGEIERLQIRLKEVTNERENLTRLLGGGVGSSGGSNDGVGMTRETALIRIKELALERDDLRTQLLLSHQQNATLSTELTTTEAQIESISERVRVKLEEQKRKLGECWEEIRRARGRERVLEGMLGWERGEERSRSWDGGEGERREEEMQRSRSE